MSDHPVLRGYVLPGLPQPLLTPEKNPGYARLRDAFGRVREQIAATDADLILVYSTMWPSVIGHQIQARPEPEWVHVDELFHDLGSIPYKFRIDSQFAAKWNEVCATRGLPTRTINYHGFPIDTGSVVTLKLINPDNRLPAVIASSNVYADRAETVVFAKAAVEALRQTGKKAIAVIVSSLSNRFHQEFIDPADDRIYSLKDHEWNLKMLEFLEAGRLEDVSQLSRQIQREARVRKVVNFKPFWWLASVMGPHNFYKGTVFGYEPVFGAGAAVVGLDRAAQQARDLEFDEEDPEVYAGERNVLDTTETLSGQAGDLEEAPGAGE